MQRVLHINSEFAGDAGIFAEKYRTEIICIDENVEAILIDFDDFADFNNTLFEFILNTNVRKYIYKILSDNLEFFNAQERSMIYVDICESIRTGGYISGVSAVTAAFSVICPDGIFHFRLKSMQEDINRLCAEISDEYILKNEYLDFIRMLRFFASVNYGSVDTLHVVIRGEFNVDIYDSSFNEYNGAMPESGCCELGAMNEIFEYDSVVSTLVEASPKSIVLHNWQKFRDSEMIETLINIFDDRIKYCGGCTLCSDR